MIYPMFTMVLVTLAIGIIAFFRRVNSVRLGEVKPRDYKLMDAKHYPNAVVQSTRCFNNQFEVPVLFYVGCLSYLALNITSPIGTYIAWAFVAARIAHAYIHITYNHLLHRIIAFWLSVLLVLALWVNLIIYM